MFYYCSSIICHHCGSAASADYNSRGGHFSKLCMLCGLFETSRAGSTRRVIHGAGAMTVSDVSGVGMSAPLRASARRRTLRVWRAVHALRLAAPGRGWSDETLARRCEAVVLRLCGRPVWRLGTTHWRGRLSEPMRGRLAPRHWRIHVFEPGQPEQVFEHVAPDPDDASFDADSPERYSPVQQDWAAVVGQAPDGGSRKAAVWTAIDLDMGLDGEFAEPASGRAEA